MKLRLKEGVKVEELKKLGFKISQDSSTYFINGNGFTLFIWRENTDDYYKQRYVYLELEERQMILEDLSIITDLGKLDIFEKVVE